MMDDMASVWLMTRLAAAQSCCQLLTVASVAFWLARGCIQLMLTAGPDEALEKLRDKLGRWAWLAWLACIAGIAGSFLLPDMQDVMLMFGKEAVDAAFSR